MPIAQPVFKYDIALFTKWKTWGERKELRVLYFLITLKTVISQPSNDCTPTNRAG